MRFFVASLLLLALAATGLAVISGFSFLPTPTNSDEHEQESSTAAADAAGTVKLTDQAMRNLGLRSEEARGNVFWKALELSGVVIDRPGVSDRGVVSPVAGIVSQIHTYPGENVRPGAPLFTIRLVSESLNLSQLELFKAAQDIEINRAQKDRLVRASESGSLAGSRIIEIENQLRRLEASIAAYRQDLQLRGLSTEQIDQAERGKFLAEYKIVAPTSSTSGSEFSLTSFSNPNSTDDFSFQMQTLEVKLGEQIQAGEVLCYLADHRSLLIEGRAFTDDLPAVQLAALNRLPVELQFDQSKLLEWSPLEPKQIQHVANTIDAETRTFGFYIPLQNEWRTYSQDSRARQLWRFRPGDRLKIRVPTEKIENAIVVPIAAVAREGINAYVFRQNGNNFDRLPVHILHEDRQNMVLANDGSIPPGVFLAQSGAASLNRILKSRSVGSAEAKMHVHADGSVHAAH